LNRLVLIAQVRTISPLWLASWSKLCQLLVQFLVCIAIQPNRSNSELSTRTSHLAKSHHQHPLLVQGSPRTGYPYLAVQITAKTKLVV